MSINSQAHIVLDVQDDTSLTILDPRDGSEVGTLPCAVREQVSLAVSLARSSAVAAVILPSFSCMRFSAREDWRASTAP